MCLQHPEFRKWLTASETSCRLLAIIFDEAHCISQWGGDFRPAYAQVDKLRALVPIHVPVLLTSATLNQKALKEVCEIMKVDLWNAFYLNRGNHRANISVSVFRMEGSKDFTAVCKYLPRPEVVTSPADFPKSIIFTNSVNDTQILCRKLRQYYGNKYDHCFGYLHAHRTRGPSKI